jgi:tripeptide aminopeptidase
MSLERLTNTLIELVGISSTTGHEEHIRLYLEKQLAHLGLRVTTDVAGNLIGLLPASEESASIRSRPLMLNAHMDRVPPGLGHQPVLRDGVLYSDGTTNLGADDAAGIVIILEVLRQLIEHGLSHPPLVVVFTVQEEVGLVGASAFDSAAWDAAEGIVFDNAFEAGAVVSRGATYLAFDVELTGRTGHPGKDLYTTVSVIDIFRDAAYPRGSLADDQTRILVSRIQAGSARNAVPAAAHIEGELRSHESPDARERYMLAIREAFEQAAQQHGGSASVTFIPHCASYSIDEHDPLLATYRAVLERRGEALAMHPSFIGSDTSAFRPRVKTFTLSTGVMREHSTEEYVELASLHQIAQDTLQVLQLWGEQTR